MDMLEIQLLKTILLSNSISSTSLETKFNLSKGKIDYRIRKINADLEMSSLGKIKKEGVFFTLTGDEKEIKSYVAKVSPTIHFSDKERSSLLYMIILLNQEETLQTLAEKMFVSKNTVIKDKKRLQAEHLDPLGIKLDFSRKKGFFLTGNEVEIRRLGIKMIREIEKTEDSLENYLTVIGVKTSVLEKIKERIHHLEHELGLEFTELKLQDLYLISYMCSTRSQQENMIREGEIGSYVQMVEKDFYSKVYTALKPFFREKNSWIEVHFISIQLLSTSLIKIRSPYKDLELLEKIRAFINNFEILGITDIKNKIHLEEALYQHLIPAYYRIKFGLPDNEMLSLDSIENYEFIHPLVKQSIGMIEAYLDISFPEGELIYISIILLSFINEELDNKNKKKRAVVICQHGVSVSKLLLGELKLLFEDIEFIQNMSLREFYQEDMEKIDMVFSTVPVNTTKELFIVNHLLTDEDKIQLKNEVRRRVNFDRSRIGSENKELIKNVINIVKKNTNVVDEEQLIKELQNCVLSSEMNLEVKAYQKRDPSLVDLLPISHIQIYRKVASVEEAIRIAGKPLIKEGYVSPDYIEKVIEHHDPEYPYSVIAPNVAIPHAGPEDGVYKIGMSLLKLDEPVEFAEGIFISLIIVIAPKDKKSHIKAVTRLYELTKEQGFISVMKNLRYEKEIHEFFEMNCGRN